MFTYNANLSNPLDYVRFRMNDTDADMPLYQDGEIQYFINKYDNPTESDLNRVALNLLKQYLYKIATGPARERAGSYEVYSMSAETLKVLIADLEAELKGAATPQVLFGGVFKDQVRRNRDNPAITDNVWHRDQFDEDYEDGFFTRR